MLGKLSVGETKHNRRLLSQGCMPSAAAKSYIMKSAKTDELLSIESDEFVWSQSGLSEAHQHILPILRAWLKDAGVRSLLDIGSGNGAVANELNRAGIEVTGIEVSQSGLAIARAAY